MTKKKKQALGKGLGALLPTHSFADNGYELKESPEEVKSVSHNIFALIEISEIKQNPFQPRKEFDDAALEDLKRSIEKHGVIQPITVRRNNGGYELISGERRLRASTKAGLKEIPAYILEVDTDEKMLELAIIENVQRENLNPIEVSHGYQRLIDECGLTQEQVALKIGKERSTITNFLRLLKLPEKVQDELRQKTIAMGHARALLSLNDGEKIEKVCGIVKDKSLSVRATESFVRDIISGKADPFSEGTAKKPVSKSKPHLAAEDIIVLEDTENRLRQYYGTEVKIHTKSKESGKIEFEFYSKDDFDRLVEVFSSLQREDK